MTCEDAVKKLREAFPDSIHEETQFRGETSLRIAKSSLRDICLHARDRMGFDYLVDVSSVDHFGQEPRYEMVYELYSLRNEFHLRLKTEVSAEDAATLLKLIDVLDDDDDVQTVWGNYEIPDAVMEKLG